MSDQNPWKKQMMMNKTQNNATDNNSSPISQFPKQEKITPPWMKKNQQASHNNTVTSNQPSWMKAKQPATTSQPPWMKNNTQTTQSNNNSATPTWMQNKNNQQPSNVPAWKAGGSMFGADKKKKQEQERLKKQQQEKQRLEREEQQRKQAQQQRQREPEQRQQRQMQAQDQRSRQREAYDLERQRQLKRVQQEKQRKRLEEEEMNNKKFQEKQKQYLSSSSKKHFASCIRLPPSPQSPIYIKFLHYYSQSINPSLDYKQKISQQKQLIKICKEFSKQMKQKIVQLVCRKIQGDTKILSQDKRNKIVNLEHLNTQLYYALCEGQQKESGSDDSQSNQQNIKFDMSSIQRFQNVFTFYNILTDILISMSKKQPSSVAAKFRVPLFTFLQYKGISFLCQAYTTEILSTQSVLPSEYKEIAKEYALIERELKQKYYLQLGKNEIMVKKVYLQEIQQEVYIFYLKNWNIIFSNDLKIGNNKATIEQLTTDYYFLSQCENKGRISLIPQVQFETFRKVRTQSFIELADVVQLAQCIFIVYSSCQGQVEQKQFWQLIISESEQIWALIRSAGYKGKLQKNKRFLFQIFQLLSGVKIKFESKKSPKHQKLSIKQSKCLISTYDFGKVEINEVIRNFQKYVKQNKLQLAQHCLQLIKDLQFIQIERRQNNNQNQDASNSQQPVVHQQKQRQTLINNNNQSIAYVIKHSKLLLAQSKPSSAAKMLQKFISNNNDKLKNNAFANIPIKMELLLLYIKMKKQVNILQTFKQLLQLVQFYYGPQNLINAVLYQMLASYYSLVAKNSQDTNNLQNHIITLYEHATSILIKYYGDQSEQIAQLYLSRAVSFLNLKKYDHFNRDIQHALKIFKSQSRQKQKIAQCLFYKGKERIQNESVENKSQGIQMIEQSAGIFMKICLYPQAIDGLMLVIQMLDQKKQQNIKKIETLSNLVIDTLLNYFKSVKHISRAIRIIVQKIDPQISSIIQQQCHRKIESIQQSEQKQGKSQLLNPQNLVIEFQQIRKSFQSFTQIIKWLNWNSNLLHKQQSYQNPSKQKFDEIVNMFGSFLSLKDESECQQENYEQEQQGSQQNLSNNLKSQKQSQYSQQNEESQLESPIRKISKKSSMASNFSQSEQIVE